MSTSPNATERTEPKPTDAPDHHEIAARLECDAEELRQFVSRHPNPTPPIVLGWATADPQHRDAVERWLADRDRRHAEQLDELRESFDGCRADEDGRQFTDHGGNDV